MSGLDIVTWVARDSSRVRCSDTGPHRHQSSFDAAPTLVHVGTGPASSIRAEGLTESEEQRSVLSCCTYLN